MVPLARMKGGIRKRIVGRKPGSAYKNTETRSRGRLLRSGIVHEFNLIGPGERGRDYPSIPLRPVGPREAVKWNFGDGGISIAVGRVGRADIVINEATPPRTPLHPPFYFGMTHPGTRCYCCHPSLTYYLCVVVS